KIQPLERKHVQMINKIFYKKWMNGAIFVVKF
ncbi:MAG: hypothetical protein K0R82_987, partial [Flavipsychrobacter sp.]|nr:hypothetical protein [Flavipsychrobacter sp.]